MTVDVYGILGSPPCRAVLMTAKILGLDVNLKHLDITKGEQMTPEFLKMNPQHTVPTIDDNGFILYESRAIMTYFVNKYGKDDSLYPADPQKRAIVDQRLYFDMGTLCKPFADYFYTCVLGSAPHDEEKLKKLTEPLVFLEKMLEGSEFVAGNTLTLGDIAMAASLGSIDVTGIVNLSEFPNIKRWFAKCSEVIPGYDEINRKGALDFKVLWDTLMAAKKQDTKSCCA